MAKKSAETGFCSKQTHLQIWHGRAMGRTPVPFRAGLHLESHPRALPRSTCKNGSTSDPHPRAKIRTTVRMVRGILSLFQIKALICIHFSHLRNPTALSFLADFFPQNRTIFRTVSQIFSHGLFFFLVDFLFLSLSRVRFSDFFKAF